jgi:FtsP/CotA-like multicopper oxidase with cupredoxin domain
MRNLGAVHNGRVPLGRVDLEKFIIMISAESSATVAERTGRLVLRGNSPSTRMQRHDVLMLPGGSGAMGDMRGWPMPPMDTTIPMYMPGIEALVPPVAPYLPQAPPGVRIPDAKPRTVMNLRDGDALSLDAELVRRTIQGHSLLMYGFNGEYPGPLLMVPQNATITVDFRNRLSEPTAVHWHGVRLDNRFDGAAGVTQEPIKPGEKFLYRVHFPDAGIFWYHSHVREDVQQDLGLYGNVIVRSSRPDYWEAANREEILMLDDLLLGTGGLVPYGAEASTHTLMGRFGNVFLINGEPRYRLSVARGEVVRFCLTNVSNTRSFNLSFSGAQAKLVGADEGKFERETWVESIPIAPAQRYVVDVRFPTSGDVALLNQVQAINHSFGYFFPQTDTLGVVHVGPTTAAPDYRTGFATLRANRDVSDQVAPYRQSLARAPDHELLLTLKVHDLPFALEQLLQIETGYFSPVEWSGTMPMMDWLATANQARWILRDPATGKENMAIDWHFKVGDLLRLRLRNDRNTLHAMAHPIHIHGQRFLVLSQNGVPNDDLVWKDTILVPVGSTAELLVEMTNPGRWMIHCHIAEHLESGMMGVFQVD